MMKNDSDFVAEFTASAGQLTGMGITQEQYVRTRRRDEGLATDADPVPVMTAEQTRNSAIYNACYMAGRKQDANDMIASGHTVDSCMALLLAK